MNRKLFCIVAALLLGLNLSSQNAQKHFNFNFNDPSENFYVTQKRFNRYFEDYLREYKKEKARNSQRKESTIREKEQELAGYEVYKRWEHFMAPRVYPSGDKTLASKAYIEYLKYSQQQAGNAQNKSNNTTNPTTITPSPWQAIGPIGDVDAGDAGRINAVIFDPTNTNGLWSCAPDGGLWSSSNLGASWNTNTDFLSSIGVSDVVFDPTNPQNMFMATGDGAAGDCYSIGILKSTDGGVSWNPTSLSWSVSQGIKINKLLQNPQNKNTIFAATSMGLYLTQDFGVTWSVVLGGDVKDVEYKPSDTTRVYAANGSFFRSTNGGSSFSNITSGLPTSGVQRFAIAVTPANSSYVYLVASDNSNSGFLGFYQSINSGVSFVTKASSPNLLGWDSSGGDTGGQGWYTLSIDASPSNANEVVVGGVNVWRTTDQGTNWSLFAHWWGDGGVPYVHADIHNLNYKNGTTLFAGTDGGVFYTNNSGASFSAINGNMNIAQIYKLGNSASTYSMIITGHQDNGTNLLTSSWGNVLGGDGMSCFIDRTDDQVMYGSYQVGGLQRSNDGGLNWTNADGGLGSQSAPWLTPWHQDPSVANTIYAGLEDMFKSVDQGNNWTQMGIFGNLGDKVTEFAVAPSNAQVIYVIKGNNLYKTTNGGSSWINITGTLPVSNAQLTWVTVKDIDPNTLFVTFSGYSAGDKVFKSTNGGSTWTNYSVGLPNLPVNCITYVNSSSDAVYVGCDVGVYYSDLLSPTWTLYNTDLPNVSVSDIQIFYPSAKIRCSTYGRGVWEASLYNSSALVPTAVFQVSNPSICSGGAITYSDVSTNTPTAWNWQLPGGVPATSTNSNPTVTYASAGVYSVTLIVSNISGNSTPVTQTINVNPTPTVSVASQTICYGNSTTLFANGAASYSWGNGANTMSVSVSPTMNTSYSVNGSLGNCSAMATAVVLVDPCAGLNTLGAKDEYNVQIIPNPNNGQFELSTTIKGYYSIKVYNNLGQLIYDMTTDKSNVSLDLSSYSKGIYKVLFNVEGNYKTVNVAIE